MSDYRVIFPADKNVGIATFDLLADAEARAKELSAGGGAYVGVGEDGDYLEVSTFYNGEKIWSRIPEKKAHWTTQPPTEPGWYWYENSDAVIDAVELRRNVKGDLWAIFGGAQFALAEVEGAWFSEPLTVPPTNKE